MGQVLVKDLPSTALIDPESFVIIERPGIGEGTFKSTVGDLQKAITVTARVTRNDDTVHIYLNDINGTTEEDIVLPIANVTREGKKTTIKIHDYRGTTEQVVIVPTAVITRQGQLVKIELTDEDATTSQYIFVPIAEVTREDNTVHISVTDENGSTSEDIVVPTAEVTREGQIINIDLTDENGTTTKSIFVPIANVTRHDNIIHFEVTDEKGATAEDIVLPTAVVTDNGDNTSTIYLTDVNGITQSTVVNKVVFDSEPTPGSPNMLTSGTIYNITSGESSRIDVLDQYINELREELDSARTRISELESRLSYVEAEATTALTIEDNQYIGDESTFMSEGETFETLKDAILATAKKGGTVTLLADSSSTGLAVAEGSNFTLDLNGHTLAVTGPGAGSAGTETNGMQLLKDSNITIKNGELIFNDLSLKIGIQNYSNLTLDNVIVYGGLTIQYVISNNFGNITFKNGTSITSSSGNIAFDAWYGMSAVYDEGVKVTIEDDTVEINGPVEFGKAFRASLIDFKNNAYIKCPTNMTLDVNILTPPCQWVEDSEYKVLSYSGDLNE